MNRLEKFVRDNRSLFDEDPPAGHFERFQEKMTRKHARIVTLRRVLSIAASIAILMTAGIVWLKPEKHDETLICENASDLKICYLEKMDIVASQIEELVMDFDYWDRTEIMNEVQSIFEAVNSDFESELPEELPEDEMNEILSEYYRLNLQGLEMIFNIVYYIL